MKKEESDIKTVSARLFERGRHAAFSIWLWIAILPSKLGTNKPYH